MYVPANSSQPSGQATDLGQRIADTVRSYLADNPGVRSTDVSQAFGVARQLLRRELGAVSPQLVAVFVSALVGLLVLGIFVAYELNGGWDPRFPAVSVAIVVIAVAALTVAVVRHRT